MQMTFTTLRSSEDIISGILNWVCPECGGRMGGRTREFKCQGQCQTDWRQAWESSRVMKAGNKTKSPHVIGKQNTKIRRTQSISGRAAEFGVSPWAPRIREAV